MDRNGRDASKSRQTLWSLSARRAWIEIFTTRTKTPIGCVALRKESVDRNRPQVSRLIIGFMSLSARRAWIEIYNLSDIEDKFGSLSARRAWIEIASGTLSDTSDGRSPQGERG